MLREDVLHNRHDVCDVMGPISPARVAGAHTMVFGNNSTPYCMLRQCEKRKKVTCLFFPDPGFTQLKISRFAEPKVPMTCLLHCTVALEYHVCDLLRHVAIKNSPDYCTASILIWPRDIWGTLESPWRVERRIMNIVPHRRACDWI